VAPFSLPKFLTVPFLALALAFLAPGPATAANPDPMKESLDKLQEEWARIFFKLPESEQAKHFKALLKQAHALREQYPERAEPLVFEGIVLCTYAGAEGGLSALSKVKKARRLLQSSLDIDPKALEGSAYIALGNLYHRLPGWPISYGDDDVARTHFEAALKLFPDAIDTNYFYGDFLLGEGQYDEALPYLEKAAKAPIRPDAQLSDQKLKEEIKQALADARAKKNGRSDFFGGLLPSFVR
jgi:tetratricopeptide (TPR) repeat protein